MNTQAPDPSAITLARGKHETRAAGMCAMEAVAWLAGEPHTDAPRCAGPVLGAFVRSWNDALEDEQRNRLLLPYLLRLVGAAGTPEVEERRAWMAADWLVREHAPAWLDLAGLTDHAAALRALPEVTPTTTAAALPIIRAALDAARAAARAAAGAASWAASWVAVWAAARAAAGDASWAASWVAVWDAAGAAAWDAARDAAARGKDIAPTVAALQASACRLLDRMIDAKGVEP